MQLPLPALITLAVVVLAACESGTSRQLNAELSAGAAAAGTAEAPALVATDIMGGPTSLLALCGQAVEVVSFGDDQDFSCAGRDDEAEVVVHAWVEPMPDGLDAARFCDLASMGEGIDLTGALVDGGAPVVPSLDRATHQGSATATWMRDFSPCGGSLEAAVTVE